MIRTVWLATICLAVLGALAAGKAMMMPANSFVAERPSDQITVGTGFAEDTLSKTDRLEITYARQDEPARVALQPAEVVPAVSSILPPIENKIISRHWRDPNGFIPVTKLKQTKQAVPKKKTNTGERKGTHTADRSKPAEPVKRCSRPGAVGELLRSLNLSPACDS